MFGVYDQSLVHSRVRVQKGDSRALRTVYICFFLEDADKWDLELRERRYEVGWSWSKAGKGYQWLKRNRYNRFWRI